MTSREIVDKLTAAARDLEESMRSNPPGTVYGCDPDEIHRVADVLREIASTLHREDIDAQVAAADVKLAKIQEANSHE